MEIMGKNGGQPVDSSLFLFQTKPDGQWLVVNVVTKYTQGCLR